jgi:hypothetical protein
MQKNQYTPLFTPRFHLSDTALVGIEVQIKQSQRILTDYEAFRLIQSGNSGNLLEQISASLSQWSKKAEKPLYLSWGLCSKANPTEMQFFLEELSLQLPLSQLEIVLDGRDLTTSEAFAKSRQILDALQDRRIRKGLFHSRPFEFNVNEIRECIDLFKLKKSVIRDMKEDLSIASQGHSVIERLNAENIEIVADDLYSKSDVTCAILMGIGYGQGYFLSRNQIPEKVVKKLEKKPGSNFYERRFDYFQDFMNYA